MDNAPATECDKPPAAKSENKESEGFFTGIKWTDAIIAVFTVVLAIYTARLFYVTWKLADAAMLQAKAVIGVELPIIVAQNFVIRQIDGIYSPPEELPKNPTVYVRFYNYGRSPAEMLGYSIVPKIINKLPDVPEPVIYPVAPGTIIERSNYREFFYIFEWSSDQRSKILAGETRLWVYGSVAYKDFLGNRHDVGFCSMALPGANNRVAFVYSSDTPPAYTYRKSG